MNSLSVGERRASSLANSQGRRLRRIAGACAAGLLVACAFAGSAHAAPGYQNLAVVKPVMSCEQLAQADLGKIKEANLTIRTASIRDTDKGPYCRVRANDAANYVAIKGPIPYPQVFTNETSKLIGPDNQKFYVADGDKLVVAKK